MLHTHPREIEFYTTQNGKTPFTDWFESLRNRTTINRIERRINRLENGNFGDCNPVGQGVFELRIHFGPGYRIYFGEFEHTILVLLCGGDKSSQQRDIERAKTYWLEYKEAQR